MDKEQLAKILADHAKWLSGNGGSRANLTRACLREACLSRTNLSRADLSRADLSEACLYRADLRRADLSRAYLSDNHYVIGCTLSNYPLVAFMQDNELCVTSGCRRGLTIADAREHWSLSNIVKWTQKHEAWGAQRLRQIDFLEAEASHLGWTK